MDGLAIAAGHEDRHAPLKSYCRGLLLPGERKSIEPMAARLEPGSVQAMRQSLHHLGAKAPWSGETLLEHVRKRVLPAMRKQGPVVAWIVPMSRAHSNGGKAGSQLAMSLPSTAFTEVTWREAGERKLQSQSLPVMLDCLFHPPGHS